MNNIKRKIKKLVKNPALFIKDMRIFSSNEIKNNSGIIKKPVAKPLVSKAHKSLPLVRQRAISTLKEDFVTPHEQEDIFFKLLDRAGINYHIISLPWQHIIRIAVQDAYVNNVIDLIKKHDAFTKEVFIAKGQHRYDLVKIYFHDESTLYKSKIIQLDPWYLTPSGVLTRNKNNLLQFVPKAHINKTVHSFSPIRLGRESDEIDDLKDMVNIDSFLFDEYSDPIDIVYTWVSDSDPIWRKKKNFHSGKDEDFADTRFVDYEQLRYSLRSVAYYAKFIRNIFIVTDEQTPYWLDTCHDKIIMINHSDIFEDTEVLPVFNSVAIESWIHKIPGLSKNFIYANDDYFFGSPVTKSHFIHPNGLAKLFLEPIPNAYGEIFEDSEATTKISLYTAQKFYERYNKWPSYWPIHAPMIKNISILEDMQNQFNDLFTKTSQSRFRETDTISPLYLMFSYYAYEQSKAVVSSIKYEYISTEDIALEQRLKDLLIKLKSSKCDVFCLNDHRTISDGQVEKVIEFMKTAFPLAVDWELDKDM